MKEPPFEFCIIMHTDYALILGSLRSDTLLVLLDLCREYGFTHLAPNDDGPGFKLIRKEQE
jgi:hypothetical protein